MKFIGWIRGPRSMILELKEIGIQGRKTYNSDHKCFEHCEATEEQIEKMIKEIPNFCPNYFTAVLDDGSQAFEQPYWK